MFRRSLFIVVGFFLTLFPSSVHAVLGPASPSVVHIRAIPSYNPVAQNLDLWVALEIKIDEGWHITAPRGNPENFLPLVVFDGTGHQIQNLRAPEGRELQMAQATGLVKVYNGTVTLLAPLKVPLNMPGGPATIAWGVQVQACDERICLTPGLVQVPVVLQVGEAAAIHPVNLEWFQGVKLDAPPPPEENPVSVMVQQKGWWITFFLVFLAGLALNLTPCVYPMIPLTVAYFGSRKETKQWLLLARSTAYVLGISVTYTVLGVSAALTGKLFGSALQSPWLMGFVSAVLVALSLSMFGLYEIQAPTALLNRIGGSKAEGPVGAFMMGLVFGVVAAPCVDPFSIGLLTFVASKANVLLGFGLFFTLSLGLGLPYLALGYFSGEIPNLPKSGLWMVWVKQFFGFVLLGMPLYFLHSFLPDGLVRWMAGIYLLTVGIILGFVLGRRSSAKWFGAVRNGIGSMIVASGLLVMILWPQPHKLPYVAYSPELLAQATREKQPVLLDFSADWCIPCQELEANTLSDSQITSLFKYWLLVKVDLTRFSDEHVQAVRRNWGVSGVPTLILIGTDGKEAPGKRLAGMVDPSELYRRMMNVR